MTDRMAILVLLAGVATVILGVATAPPAQEAKCHGLTVLPGCAEVLRR